MRKLIITLALIAFAFSAAGCTAIQKRNSPTKLKKSPCAALEIIQTGNPRV